MAEKDFLLTDSQELNLLMEQDVGTYSTYITSLFQNNSMGQEQNDQLNYHEEYVGLFKGEDNSQLLQGDLPELQPQDVSQLYQPQTANNYANQNNYNNQLMSYHPSTPNLNQLPVTLNYLSPINRLSQQINEVKMPPIISTEDYAGPYNFDVYFNPLSVKNPWLYSPSLDKLFITMGESFPVDFKRDGDSKDLYIRATTLYSSPQLNQEIVVRCWSHSAPENPLNMDVPEHMISHVLRCQDSNSNYQGNDKRKQHLSVVVPLGLPQPGTDVVCLIYYFVCKNSCPTGINRRPTCVIFTLEDKFGVVKGRRRLNVRVCSCPKRDKEKEERDAKSGPAPRGKKRKMEKVEKKETSDDVPVTPTDNKEQKLTLTVYGKESMLLVLNGAHDRLTGALHKHGPNENLKKALTEIEEQLKKYED